MNIKDLKRMPGWRSSQNTIGIGSEMAGETLFVLNGFILGEHINANAL
ncbi:hypothetical protein [Leptospira ellinghausenii]|nr:hypothetical protein [Leptospira ellinghausenii]